MILIWIWHLYPTSKGGFRRADTIGIRLNANLTKLILSIFEHNHLLTNKQVDKAPAVVQLPKTKNAIWNLTAPK